MSEEIKGFAPWSREKIFEYRYHRRERIEAKRPRLLRQAARIAEAFKREQAKKAAR